MENLVAALIFSISLPLLCQHCLLTHTYTPFNSSSSINFNLTAPPFLPLPPIPRKPPSFLHLWSVAVIPPHYVLYTYALPLYKHSSKATWLIFLAQNHFYWFLAAFRRKHPNPPEVFRHDVWSFLCFFSINIFTLFPLFHWSSMLKPSGFFVCLFVFCFLFLIVSGTVLLVLM